MNYFYTYGPKMFCFDKRLEIKGTYDSEKASHLTIKFERCNPTERECKSEEEFEQWMIGKFIITIENQWIFNSDDYGDSKVTAESRFSWHLVSAKIR